jgi:hypothetical protein
MKFIANIDLSKNQLLNAAIQNLAAAPSSPVKGQIYFDTVANVLYVWNGTVWVYLGKQGTMTSLAKVAGATNPISLTGTATDPLIDLITQAGVSNGTAYTKVTVSDKGIVTLGANLAATDIPTLTAAKISDFNTAVRTNTLNLMAVPTATVNMNSQSLSNVADPINPQDAATKAYVDATKAGLDFKDSVKATTTGNIALTALQTVDGIALIAGDRVLVKDQTTGTQNGIYIVAAGAWFRSTDCDNTPGTEVSGGMYVFVEQGTLNMNSGWVLTNSGNVVLGTDSLVFTQFSGAGQITPGAGLTKAGNIINVVGTANRIVVNADSIDIASNYVGQNTITTLGTIGTGVWNGSVIGPVYGGTGLNAYAAGDTIYASAVNTLAKLAGNTSATKMFMSMTSSTPSWGALINADIPTALTGKTYNGMTLTTAANTFTLTVGTADLIVSADATISGSTTLSGTTTVAGTLSIPLSSGLTRSGAHGLTITTTAATSVTMPTSGILLSTDTMASSGYPKKYSVDIGNASATSITVNHALNTEDITVTLRDKASKEIVYTDITIIDANNVRLDFAVAPTLNSLRVVVIG